MDISSIDRVSAGASTKRSVASNSDFETFLRMLTTQVQNQDPLSPMETNEFANQLAAFTMVEQQTLANQTLREILTEFQGRSLPQYAQLVGKTAVHDGPFFFSGAPKTFEVLQPIVETPLKLVILDQEGRIASELYVETGAERVEWSGQDTEGRFLDVGTYTAELQSAASDQRVDARIGVASTVEEVRFDADQVQLVLADGSIVTEMAIQKLR